MCTNFYCPTCSSTVHLDISNSFKILSGFGLNSSGIISTTAEIVYKENSIPVANFYCTSCLKDVNVSNLCGGCSQCGKILDIRELSFSLETYSIYCKSCLNILHLTTSTESLNKILSKLTVTRKGNR